MSDVGVFVMMAIALALLWVPQITDARAKRRREHRERRWEIESGILMSATGGRRGLERHLLEDLRLILARRVMRKWMAEGMPGDLDELLRRLRDPHENTGA